MAQLPRKIVCPCLNELAQNGCLLPHFGFFLPQVLGCCYMVRILFSDKNYSITVKIIEL
jgi:hypothetical protein